MIAVSLLVLFLMMVGWIAALTTASKMYRAAEGWESPSTRRYSMGDFLALFVAVLPPLAILSMVWRLFELPRSGMLLFGGILVPVFAHAWWRSISLLSDLNIEDARRRFVYLAVVEPLLLVGTFFAAGEIIMAFVVFDSQNFPYVPWMVVTGGTGVVGALLHFTIRWIVAGAARQDNKER